MTTLAAPAVPTSTRALTGAELAARIQIPRRLPVRHDGQPLRHLSHSSYSKFLLCPDDWRRHYLLGQRTPPSAHMFLGARVDDALSTYHRQLLELRRAAHARPAPGRLPRPLDARAGRRTGQARRALGPRARRAARVHDGPGGARAHRPRAAAAARPPGRRPARARLRARARPGVDDPGLPGPRDAARRRRARRRAGPGDRRLQGQEHAALAGQGRPRPAGRALPRRPLARRRARRALLLRPDRQTRHHAARP